MTNSDVVFCILISAPQLTCQSGKYFYLSPQSLSSRLESLERTVTSQQNIITAQEALLSKINMIDTPGGLQSYDVAQVQQRICKSVILDVLILFLGQVCQYFLQHQ